MPVISCKFKASSGYLVRCCLKRAGKERERQRQKEKVKQKIADKDLTGQ
jgi:hypothetical protein